MLTSNLLRQLIKDIYNFEEEFIIPVSSNCFLPDVTLIEKPGTYIGYRILSKRIHYSQDKENKQLVDAIKVSFRLSLVGIKAEELADQIHFWNDNHDIQKLFASYKLRFNYSDMTNFTYPMRKENSPAEIAWICDMSCCSDYFQDLKQINTNIKQLSLFRRLITKGGSK